MKKTKLILRIIAAIVCFAPSILIIYFERMWFLIAPVAVVITPFLQISAWLQNKKPDFTFIEILKFAYYAYAEPVYFWLHYIKNEKYDFNTEYSKHF